MSSSFPDRPKTYEALEHWFKTMNQIMQEKPVKEILQGIDDFFRNPFPNSSFHTELEETENEYIVKAELPGVKKDQLTIDIFDNSLTITVNKMDLSTEVNDLTKTQRQTAAFQKSSRTIPFSKPINEQKISASYTDGLLQINIAKKLGRKIDIFIDNE